MSVSSTEEEAWFLVTPQTVTVSPIDTESPVTEWPASCDHYLSYGQLAACRMAEAPGKVLLAEGCSHSNCRVVRIVNLENGQSSTVCKNVIPDKICTGPGNSLLVCDSVAERILHLASAPEFRNFSCANILKVDFLPVQSMCYSNHSNAVVFSKLHSKKVFAINLTTGYKLWEVSQSVGSIDSIELNPEDVCSTPQGWTCVANRTNLLFLRPSNGDLVSVQRLEDITPTDGPKPRKQPRRMLGQSSATEPGFWVNPLLSVPPQASYQHSLFDRAQWSHSTAPGSSQENGLSEDHLEQEKINKVMCSENDLDSKLAVQYQDGSICNYSTKSIVDQRYFLENTF